jgi:signal transduction histidine kinase
MHAVRHQGEITSPVATPTRAWMRWFDPGEPHPARGPFTRWPRVTDGALAVLVFAGSLIAVAASQLGDGEDFTIGSIVDRPAGVFVMLAITAAAMLWRRRQPVVVAIVVMVVMIAWALAGYGDGGDVGLIVAVYAVGRYTAVHRHSVSIVAATMVVGVVETIIDTSQRIDIAPAVILSWLPWYVGRRVRNRGDYVALLQERAARLEADQHAEALRAVADERSRIARELHDVVAHQVSMMTVQAGAAKTVARDDLDTAIEAMGDVERSGRRALGELRHLLGVLRPTVAEEDYLRPQPGLADVPALADELRHTGADVHLTIAPVRADLSATVELTAYRIVQESFTNIVKHAGPRPTVEVTIGFDDVGLDFEIVNTITTEDADPTGAPALPTSGYGISGMHERVTLVGGTLAAGLDRSGRFRVEAHIPVERELT